MLNLHCVFLFVGSIVFLIADSPVLLFMAAPMVLASSVICGREDVKRELLLNLVVSSFESFMQM